MEEFMYTIRNRRKKEASEEEAEKLTVVDFKTDDVTAFSYVLGGQVYAYRKQPR